MIPNTNGMATVQESAPAVKDFYLHLETKQVAGFVDGKEGAHQAAWLILHTERFHHEIYSFDYGTQLEDLMGRGDGFLFSEIKRRVTEALMMDERLVDATNFEFLRRGNRVSVRFVLHTRYDALEMEFFVG